MRILIVKLSSMGDVVHLLPAVTELVKARPEMDIHWAVEEAFAEIPAWHYGVRMVIPVKLRALRQRTINHWPRAYRLMKESLRSSDYDLVVDAQGLIKSALLARLAQAPVAGLDRNSAREPFAATFYQQKHAVDKDLHAIHRNRRLFSQIFSYDMEDKAPLDSGIRTPESDLPLEIRDAAKKDFVLGFHGSAWETKVWPKDYWGQLGKILANLDIRLFLSWGNEEERQRAEHIKLASPFNVVVPPKLSLSQLAVLMAKAKGFVGADTGLAHLAAAIGIPGVTLYGPTDAKLTGVLGARQRHFIAKTPCAPCKKRKCAEPLTPEGMLACQASLTPSFVAKTLLDLVEH